MRYEFMSEGFVCASLRAETRLSGNNTSRKKVEKIARALEDRLVNT